MSWIDDKAWSDRYVPIIRQLVGPHLLVESPLDVDQKQAADLIVLRARDMTIACRVRRYGFADRFPWDFTVRAHRDSGAKTELAKFIEGWGDWMFYGHASEDPGALDRWMIVDLSIWRAELARDAWRAYRGKQQKVAKAFDLIPNGDGTYFAAFDVRNFPPALVITASHDVDREVVTSSEQFGLI